MPTDYYPEYKVKRSYLSELLLDYVNQLNVNPFLLVLIVYAFIGFTVAGITITGMMTMEQYSHYFKDELSIVMSSAAVAYAAWVIWFMAGLIGSFVSIYYAITKNDNAQDIFTDILLGSSTYLMLGVCSIHILIDFKRTRNMKRFEDALAKARN